MVQTPASASAQPPHFAGHNRGQLAHEVLKIALAVEITINGPTNTCA